MNHKRATQADRSAATRAALVAAARPLFLAHGFAGAGTEAIVRAAGVTRGALYHQFADKTELFATVFETIEIEVLGEIDAAVGYAGRTDPIEMMRQGARAWLEAFARPDVERIVLVEAPAALGWERWRELGLRHSIGLVVALLTQAIADGRLPRQPVDPLAHLLIGALDEAALYAARSPEPERARTEVGDALDRLILALAVAPRPVSSRRATRRR